MQFAAQIQTSIELLEELFKVSTPADKYMARFFKERRYIGSKDKGVVADTVYGVLRHKGELEYCLKCVKAKIDARRLVMVYMLRHQDVKLAKLVDLFNGDQYAPSEIKSGEKESVKKAGRLDIMTAAPWDQLNYPEWMHEPLVVALGDDLAAEMTAMSERATTDIRVNTLKSTVEKTKLALSRYEIFMEETKLSPLCLRINDRKPMFHLDEFKKGFFELQDEGSQMIALAAGVRPGMKVVDFCAGAGGKTLALAAQMENKGSLAACDVNQRRLDELPKRAKRAGVHNIQTKLLSSERDKWVKRNAGKMDVVLLDAPCSGTGTWRRSPDARWRLQEKDIQELNVIQSAILESASRMVKEGGRLVYATCSILREENEDQVQKFLEVNEGFELVPAAEWAEGVDFPESEKGMVRLSPAKNNTDGFFMAVLKKIS